jgi:hypothetical protein
MSDASTVSQTAAPDELTRCSPLINFQHEAGSKVVLQPSHQCDGYVETETTEARQTEFRLLTTRGPRGPKSPGLQSHTHAEGARAVVREACRDSLPSENL